LLDIAPPLSMRLVHAEDSLFLDALYRESRPDLLALPLAPSAIEQMIAMQRGSQSAGVKQIYPNAQDWLLCWHQELVGRLLLDMGRDDIRLIDIAVAPAWRNHGFASSVLEALQAHAARTNQSISLAVQCDNLVASRVYRRAGFSVCSSDTLFNQMIWQVAKT
jgi:ribosomal protein S18 acetylase RimI-like enzyme